MKSRGEQGKIAIGSLLAHGKTCVIICVMKTASVYDVQHNFSRVLSWVIAGETVVIRRHRVPVAKLVPTKKEKTRPKMPDFMARLKKDYGDHVAPDSQPILDELREDRY